MIDRGLKNATQTETWNKICQNIVVTLAQKEYLRAVISGVNEIGQVLEGLALQVQDSTEPWYDEQSPRVTKNGESLVD